ncbi:MAG: ABC transporter ATP-binding protein [Thermomicrobiales bacterium]
MAGASITIRHLSKSFGEVVAVSDFNLDVTAGEFLSVLGQSGSGKSTVLRMIAGLELPTGGELLIDGKNATDLPPEHRDIGMVFQDYALFPHMTVRDNVGFPLRMRGWKREAIAARVARTIDLVNLRGLEQRKPSQLSGGQQQRVALARALAFDPKLLLLDEPLSALDKNLREYMKAELKSLHQRVGITVIYVTHDQSEALALSDRIVVMHEGRIEGIDTPQDLYNTPSSRYIASFIGEANLLEGTITEVSERTAGVACTLGEWRLPLDRVQTGAAPAVGQTVTIVIRPEAVIVTPARRVEDAGVSVTCEITQALYNGSTTLYALRTTDTGIDLTARNEVHADHGPQPGDTVPVGLLVSRSVAVSS